jgi:anti-anti-sigma regulatory factor
MITSYITPDRATLYLSLVGSLNTFTAKDLVHEYHDRHVPELRRCILDLSSCDVEDEEGLDVLHHLSLVVEPKGIELSLLAGRNHAKERIADAAGRHEVPLVDTDALPFLRRLL